MSGGSWAKIDVKELIELSKAQIFRRLYVIGPSSFGRAISRQFQFVRGFACPQNKMSLKDMDSAFSLRRSKV